MDAQRGAAREASRRGLTWQHDAVVAGAEGQLVGEVAVEQRADDALEDGAIRLAHDLAERQVLVLRAGTRQQAAAPCAHPDV